MAAPLEEGIDAMQSNKASTQEQPHDLTETTILIQAAQPQLAPLASRIHSPSNLMERALNLTTITNSFGTILDSMTKLELIALAFSGYKISASVNPSSPPRDELERFLMSTGNMAQLWAQSVWDECESHIEEKDWHDYLSGPCPIRAPSPLYSTSCFVTQHQSK